MNAAEKAAAILGRSTSPQGGSAGSASSKAKKIVGPSSSEKAAAILGASTSSSKGKGKTNPVLAALSVLDLPRAAALSAGRELAGLATGDASLDDLIGQIQRHEGVGDLIKDTDLPLNAKRALGFVGDVAVDPLTYVTLGAAPAVKLGGQAIVKSAGRSISKQEVARAVAKAAAETGDEALMDLATKVARRGTGSLTTDEAARVGIRQGAQFGIGNAKVTLPGTGGLARGAEAATAPIRESVYGGKLGERIQSVLNALDPQNKLSRTGLPRAVAFSPEGPIKRLIVVDQARLAKGEARAMAHAARRSLEETVTEYKGKGLDLNSRSASPSGGSAEELRRALQGEAPTSPLVKEAAAKVRGILDSARAEASRLAGRELGYVESYLPVRFTDDLRKLLDLKKAQHGGGRLAKESVEKQRKVFVAGGKFLGETLEGATPQQVLDHAERIAKEKLGDDALELFEKNPIKLVDRAIASYQRFAEDNGLARRLGTSLDEVRSLSAGGLGPRLDNARRLEDAAGQLDDVSRTAAADVLRTIELPQAAPVSFRTAKGSTYQVHADGTTTRNKALRPEHGKDAGPQARTSRTVYLTKENASRLATPQGEWQVVESGGSLTLASRASKDRPWGAAASQRSVPFETTPKKGLIPLELWNEGSTPSGSTAWTKVHFGNEITEVSAGAAPEEITLRMQAEHLWNQSELAAEAGEHHAAAVAALEASARTELASTPPLSEERFRAVLEDGHKITDNAVAALKMLSGGDSKWVAEALFNLQKANAFTDSGWLLKAFDKVTSTWKSLAILTPGFHARNYLGGVFNNALAGVDLDTYRVFAHQYAAFRKGFASGGPSAGLAAVDEQYRQAFSEMQRVGLFGSTSGRDFADVTGTPRNAITAANRRAATAVENNLRGTLALDRMLKGASVEDALGAVAKYHFFYDETSPFFAQYVRRAVPFATWSRFNFPLQLEGMARKPGLYTRFHHLAHNIELGQEDGEEPPSWMQSLMAIRSPFLAPGGRPLFLTPDLPFRDLGETFDVNKNLANLNPILRVPVEASRGKKFFNDAPLRGEQEAPKTWTPVLAALYALGPLNGKLGLPNVKRKGGDFVLNANDANKLESMVPLLGRLRRLAPSDEKSQAKAFSSWLSFAFGISTQTVVDNESHVAAASATLRRKGSASTSSPAAADVAATKPKPLGGIRPQGGNVPKNAVIAGSYGGKPYNS